MTLTPRELQVLEQLVAGLSDREIGTELHIDRETVKRHVHHLLGKLGARNRTELAVTAIRRGLIA